ncbi:PepSY domain-containing protein [Octadecabacter sp. R77987]|uniref:PepSY domain-containing protein n=1 Tax=Octadecabacter sp. R77987 TaxID=3093874 RepID=UPI00366AA7DC
MIRVLAVLFALLAAPAFAQTPLDAVVSQLQSQGYSSISVNRTLLGRIRIVAISEAYRREIVMNPTTGEILRDYWITLGDDGAMGALLDRPGGNGHGGGYEDDDDDDEDDDDDDDDDEDDDDEDDDDEDDDDEDDDDDDDDDDDEDEDDD